MAELSDDAAAEVAASVNAFGFGLHRQLADLEANVGERQQVEAVLAWVGCS